MLESSIARARAHSAVQDLLSKILVADPNNRYTIQDIIQHPWFQADLPGRALKMNDDYLVLTPEGQVSTRSILHHWLIAQRIVMNAQISSRLASAIGQMPCEPY